MQLATSLVAWALIRLFAIFFPFITGVYDLYQYIAYSRSAVRTHVGEIINY